LKKLSIYRKRLFAVGLRLLFAAACCSTQHAAAQLTARSADGKAATKYNNAYGVCDTIFVFNQTPQPKTGNLSLRQQGASTFRWYRFDYNAERFERQPFTTDADVDATLRDNLSQGGYKVTITPQGATAPRDSFVAWLYMNPGFDFNLYKDDRGEVIFNYKSCSFTNFILRPNTEQSSFAYYNPLRLQQGVLTLDNEIKFVMKRGGEPETATPLNTQGNTQYLRDGSPPYEDMLYDFRAYDMFGVERTDRIMYRTIIPFATINPPALPDRDPASAPVPAGFTCKAYNTAEYEWRFGDGDSIKYAPGTPAPDTVKHIYYTPRKAGYEVVLKVTSMWNCTYTSEAVKISVDDPLLETANVFTPNGDGKNDYFKPFAVSLRRFEIVIYTRAGKRVYRYIGDDLRNWDGWDGRIENTGKNAAAGVYFYTIKAAGWDEPPTKNPQSGPYSGCFHLYR
jgi:gliding motility-associated-like protein